MKDIIAFMIIPKNEELANIIGEASNGVMIPFFDSIIDANNFIRMKHNEDKWKVILVKITKVKT